MMKKLIFAALIITMTIAACGKKQKQASLSSHPWQLSEVVLSDSEFTETPPMGITLNFDDSLKVASGSGGCNRYSSPYEMGDQNTILFAMPVTTLMACPDMEFEQRYLGWLVGVEKYSVDDSELRLEGGGVTLIYKVEF